jgi:hypothetical protein
MFFITDHADNFIAYMHITSWSWKDNFNFIVPLQHSMVSSIAKIQLKKTTTDCLECGAD